MIRSQGNRNWAEAEQGGVEERRHSMNEVANRPFANLRNISRSGFPLSASFMGETDESTESRGTNYFERDETRK